MHSNGPDGLVSPRIPALLEWITWLEMPFTPSHVAAVLPLRGRAGLPFAALAAGSMSPDLLYYLPGFGWSPAIPTHSLLGVVTWDLAFGLLIWMAWCWAAGPLRDMSPDVLRSRWREPGSGFPGWRLAPIAVAIGSLTHVVWDSFTTRQSASRWCLRIAARRSGTEPGLPAVRAGVRVDSGVGLHAPELEPETAAMLLPSRRPRSW